MPGTFLWCSIPFLSITLSYCITFYLLPNFCNSQLKWLSNVLHSTGWEMHTVALQHDYKPWIDFKQSKNTCWWTHWTIMIYNKYHEQQYSLCPLWFRYFLFCCINMLSHSNSTYWLNIFDILYFSEIERNLFIKDNSNQKCHVAVIYDYRVFNIIMQHMYCANIRFHVYTWFVFIKL